MKDKKGRRSSIPRSEIQPAPSVLTEKKFIEPIGLEQISCDLEDIIQEANRGLEKYEPALCEEGINGTYFLQNSKGNKVAVFKSEMEQGSSPHNPKNNNNNNNNKVVDCEMGEADILGSKGLMEGEVSVREVAAYIIDKKSNYYYGVPRTCLVQISHPYFQKRRNDGNLVDSQYGSFQEFVQSDGAAFDLSPNKFPVEEVHKIGILDLRIFNTDRHEGNILFRRSDFKGYELIPIDHSFSFPHSLDAAWFDWLHWPQAKVPFSREMLEHIESIDIESDAYYLQSMLGIRPECILTMKISTTLLKKGAANGLNLFEIGNFVSRSDLSRPSGLEVLSERAKALLYQAGAPINEEYYLRALYDLMDEEIAKYNMHKMGMDMS